jgi:hypothetical protein
MKVFWNSLVVAGAIAAIGSPAQAAQITFSLVGSKAPATTFNYSDPSGLTLSVTALGQTINQNASGLGVSGNNSSDVDSNETIQFQFNQVVKLVNTVFSNIDADDQYTLWTGNTPASVVQQIIAGSFAGVGERTTTFPILVSSNSRTAQVFQFSTFDSTDDYRLKSITVDDGKPTAVPTPAMLPGLVGLGLGVLRRRIAA